MSDTTVATSIWAAGGVVYRRRDGRIDVVLVARPRERLWALPKGKPRPGETHRQTALREVGEETGLDVAIEGGDALGAIRYSYSPDPGTRVDKVVYHYLMRPEGGHFERHDGEYDLVDWFDIHEACKRMTFPNERHILELAIAALDGAAPPADAP